MCIRDRLKGFGHNAVQIAFQFSLRVNGCALSIIQHYTDDLIAMLRNHVLDPCFLIGKRLGFLMLAFCKGMNPVDDIRWHIGIIETDVAIIADVGNGSVIAILFFQTVPDGGSIAQRAKAKIVCLGNSRNLYNAVLFFLLAVVLFKLVRRQVAVGGDQFTKDVYKRQARGCRCAQFFTP